MSLVSELRKRSVLRVAAAYIFGSWLILQVADVLFPAFGLGDAAVRLVVIVLAIGLVPVLVFSWLFDLTPDGLRREKDVDHSQPEAVRATRRFDRVVMVVLALAVGFFAFDRFVLGPMRESQIEESTAERVRNEILAESYGENSIAVLPFVNMSDDADNEYFSDGMSEEILNLLARVQRLRVISQSSSFSFKGKQFTIPEVAKQLGVSFVLEGSVRKFGERLRITAQLIDARSDSHMWSETYDRTLEDLFAIQDEISAAIVGELKKQLNIELGAAPQATGTPVIAAHEAYLRGRYLLTQRVPGSKTAAVAEFEKAIALDPDFALAHAQLAIALHLGGCGDVTMTECEEKARPHAERALALAPGLAEAHVAMGSLAFSQLDPERARFHFQRALKINPNYAEAYVWMANNGLFPTHEEEMSAREAAARLDPLSPVVVYSYIFTLLITGQLAEMDREIDRYAAIDPNAALVLRARRDSLGGNWSSLVLSYLQAASNSPEGFTYSWVAAEDAMWGLAAIGLVEEALGMADVQHVVAEIWLGKPGVGLALAHAQAEADPDFIPARFDLSVALAHMGQYAEALPLLQEGQRLVSRIIPSWGNAPGLNEDAQALVASFRSLGNEAEARRVLAEEKYRLRRYREAGILQTTWDTSIDYYEGIIDYLAGDREKGLELMAKGAMDGYWVKPPAAYQQALFQDPGFAPILERQRARQARERWKVLSVVCENNPYEAVWQPLPETCQEVRKAAN
jgi:TolB-like protein/Tfp pilus assembly protein PilF